MTKPANIDVSLGYTGTPLELPDKLPPQDEILESEDGARRLAGYLIKRQSDKIQSLGKDGKAVLRLHFKH